MLADSKMKIASVVMPGLKVARAFKRQSRFCGGRKVSGATHEPRNVLRQDVEDLGRRVA